MRSITYQRLLIIVGRLILKSSNSNMLIIKKFQTTPLTAMNGR